MGHLSVADEPNPDAYAKWGGRGLSAAILTHEVPPTCNPLGPANKLVIAPGILAGRNISSADRCSIGAKSPLTGGIKESNAGGNTAGSLVRLGIKAIVIEGQPQSEKFHLLRIGSKRWEFIPADAYTGLGTYELAEKLLEEFGSKHTLILIGPAGERRLLAAGIALTNKEGIPGRLAARGGLGAVMGSKGLKAILIENVRGEPQPAQNPDELKVAVKRYLNGLQEDYYTATVFPDLGTPYMVASMQKLGGLPTRNFRYGTFDDLSELDGHSVRDLILRRGGEGRTTHACMAGCVVRCSNVIPDEHGGAIVAPIEYESMVLLGPNLEIGSLDSVASFNYRCNDLGIDTVDVGGAIGVAMEAGILPFGDIDGVERVFEEIENDTVLGRVIGNGTATAGRVFGVVRTPVVKGQCIAGYDPRAVKGMGVTYATSPMGADHTAGHTADFPVDHHSPSGKVDLSKGSQITAAAWDTLGLCSFVTGATAPHMGVVVDMLRAIDGVSHPDEHITELGTAVIKMERAFNHSAGFTFADDRLPDYFRTEELPPFNVVFDVETDELDQIFSFEGDG
jgi:aldehyde:ferredoxin oxidoreductase